MADKLSSDTLANNWVHSHEEDVPGVLVFRPDTFAFPPSRGRKLLSLDPSGHFEGQVPGADDRPSPTSGKWSVEGDHLHLDGDRPGVAQDLTIESLEPDRLVVRR
ncbi:hypothetical protein [Tardiphaga sp.]|jgi:hypothetical protein|uniref:hypothetical protein n=1 Tax=Tardiphaga sp. TaxID=1926292 RepID=UPI0037DA72BE